MSVKLAFLTQASGELSNIFCLLVKTNPPTPPLVEETTVIHEHEKDLRGPTLLAMGAVPASMTLKRQAPPAPTTP